MEKQMMRKFSLKKRKLSNNQNLERIKNQKD